MGRFVIAACEPKPGAESRLRAVVGKHLTVLAAEGLVTDRPGCVMRGADGTLVEVFEWSSAEAIERAHRTPSRTKSASTTCPGTRIDFHNLALRDRFSR